MKRALYTTLLCLAACGDSGSPPGSSPDAGGPPPDAPSAVDGGPDAAPAAGSGPCDPVAQNCSSATDKCTLIDPSGTHNVRACVPRMGNVGLDQPCRRSAEDNTGFGRDDCAAGLSCTYLGVLPPRAGGTRLCRRFCHGDSDCPGGQRCAKVSDATPADGFCGPPCTVFANDCPGGMTCADIWPLAANPDRYFAVCRVSGATADGAACQKHEDCAPDRACVPSPLGLGSACRPLCDPAHPCAAGTCMVIDPASGAGYCN